MIKKIIEKMPPPSLPVDGGKIDWINVESKIRHSLPDDFKLFIELYGTGVIGGFLWIFNPNSNNKNLSFERCLYFNSAYEQMRELYPEEYKRPSFPENGSFFTWAASDNGDSLFWIVDGDNPNNWKVGIHNYDQGKEELFNMNSSEFLVCLIENQLSSNIFPPDFTNCKMIFTPLV